jgi:alkanesulfonate monooxygenase SsuD/methylene tetrahydromethanopterin reductase-like flavin-dependent oxidoreductase (luciferase family)
MADYLHPLRFGSFVTPIAATPQHPVDMARLSEELGLDLVTFQDHPYQAVFQDTWTLIAWVAARTSTIHVSGNVLNLPLRQPAVLARALASLDRLSDGRVELGIGTGGYFDAMATMGAPLLTPAEAVSGLDEALDIIRGIWDTSTREPLHVEGRYHRVSGAARGPAPAHDIPIWVGAYKPRMQRIIGRKGDGWLPSLPWLKPGDIERGNRVIDESARKAGRDPGDITRLMNVTPQYDADDMAELAVDHGISVFIMGSDDPQEIRKFAEVTAPRIRERVGKARRGGRSAPPPSAPTPSGAPVFRDDPLPEQIVARSLFPEDRGYARYTSGYFRGAKPGLVIRPESTEEVQEAVRFAGRHRDVPLGLFSGGHGLSGRSLNDDGIVIASRSGTGGPGRTVGRGRAGSGAARAGDHRRRQRRRRGRRAGDDSRDRLVRP